MPATIEVTAAYVSELGPVENIRYGPLEVAAPGGNDVLVDVEAVALDPVDTLVRSGRYPTAVPLPLVLGRDLVGRVAFAPAHTPFRTGQWVWANSIGHDGLQGAFADRAVVPAERCYPLADGADPARAVALAHPGSTAALGWFSHGGLRAGQTVLVGGGGGNVGTAAVVLAAGAGARIVATASPRDAGRVLAAGADVVLDHHEPDLGARLAGVVPTGVDIAWDTSGRMDYGTLADVTAPGGRILVSAAGPEPAPVPWARIYTRDIDVVGFVNSRARVDQLARAAARLNAGLAAGTLTADVTEVLPLSEAADAHRRMEAGQVRGRIVLRPGQ
ncbi:zinc-binding dehydrogenase [Pseudactinotalea sp. HY160]|uniref:zinc-binding dehydrogenase n=1 Tax=Pseudactinotalea sp. HY160 TaxID=2654490 RepID=UPI00128E7E75|nr:zinc-binding dehydrogenase [Pseudactinotalea sp. HY160]MPV49860.1 zinc-binding dehydrogenase [Pseudactinotalea sp. HY160]